MKILSKNVLIFVVSWVLLISFTGCAAHDDSTLVYVALGDSVPAGYGLSNPQEESYVGLFAALLTENYEQLETYNWAQSGITTGELLKILNDLTDDEKSVLENAGLITLNIGGNNLLRPFLSIFQYDDEASFSELATRLISIMLFEPDTAMMNDLKNGLDSFEKDFNAILEYLQTAAPDAAFIISTVYNPFPQGLGISKTAQEMINTMNEFIIGGQEASGYFIADTFTAFEEASAEGTSVVNMDLTPRSFNPDIHPTAAGHEIMAQIHKNVFKGGIFND